MKHALKSLLITTVLTLPSVFCAAPQDDALSETQKTIQSSASIVDTALRAYEHITTGNSEAAARVYEAYAKRLEALWFHVLFSAQRIEDLGCMDMAIKLFEWSKTHPNTEYFKDIAESEIARLRQLMEAQASQQATTVTAPMAESATVRPTETHALARVSIPAENKERYKIMHAKLEGVWKAVAGDNLLSLFFDGGVEGSELTSTAVLELQYGFLIKHPEIYIHNLENFGLFMIAGYSKTTHEVTIPQIQQLKNKLLN